MVKDDTDAEPHPRRPRGRPVTNAMPDPIPDTPENIARAVLQSPRTPPGGWKYLDAVQKGEPEDV